jgi:murein L,D-transpeptidase YcbB/YkuD
MFAVAAICGANPADGQATSERLRVRIEQLRGGADRVDGVPVAAGRLIADFYRRRSYVPAWTRPGQAEAMLALVEASVEHGLDPADYHAAALRRALAEPPANEAGLAERELLLTDSLVRLAYHLHFGKLNPRQLYPGWNFRRSLGSVDPVQALEAALAAPRLQDAVERFAPQLPMYRDLRVSLSGYRAIQAAGGWPRVPPGPPLQGGMQDARVQWLRARLIAEGDLAPAEVPDATRFDDALDAAVHAFQRRHGLEADGVVARRTLEALNVGVAQRIDQIRVNLERLRWVAQDLEGDYLIVDVAGFSARLFLDGRLAWSSRVVVGLPYKETPAFRATMRDVVFNPSWTVPATIVREELLPRLETEPLWLARNHMRVVDPSGREVDERAVDWARLREGRMPYQIVQAPGPDNPLGRIKFLLPNPNDVYLHDTPARELFQRVERAFSHGCIRLEQPLEPGRPAPCRWRARSR